VAQPAPATVKSLEVAEQPAKVQLQDGKLTVESSNSSLPQILHDVAGLTGISIKGLSGGPHVFGVYGPADVRQVLTALLTGSGYNFIMVGGDPASSPEQLLLTPQVAAQEAQSPDSPPAALRPVTRPQVPGVDDSGYDDPNQPQPLADADLPSTMIKDGDDEDTVAQKSIQRLQAIHNLQPGAPQ
jgi:hypothetical protein